MMRRTVVSLLVAGACLVGVRSCVHWRSARQLDAVRRDVLRIAPALLRAADGVPASPAAGVARAALDWYRRTPTAHWDVGELGRKIAAGDLAVEPELSRLAPLLRLLEPLRGQEPMPLATDDPLGRLLPDWMASVWVGEAWVAGKTDPAAALPLLGCVLILCRPVAGDSAEVCAGRLQCLSRFGMGLDGAARMAGHSATEARRQLDPLLETLQDETWKQALLERALLDTLEGGASSTGSRLLSWWAAPFRESRRAASVRGLLQAWRLLQEPASAGQSQKNVLRDELSATGPSRRLFERWADLLASSGDFEGRVHAMRLALAARVHREAHGQWPTDVSDLEALWPGLSMDPATPHFEASGDALKIELPGLGETFVVSPTP